jgi:hypothetical protein
LEIRSANPTLRRSNRGEGENASMNGNRALD